MKIHFACLLTTLFLMGCHPVTAPETAPFPTLTVTPAATSTLALSPSPTDIQLPYNSDAGSDENCKPPYAILTVGDGNDISEDEIAYELLRIWLRQYKQPATPAFCRIEDYRIEKVYDDPKVYTSALEPRGDFLRVAVFAVKLIQVPSDWMSFAGEIDQDNWLHISHVVAITKTGEGYKLEFANP